MRLAKDRMEQDIDRGVYFCNIELRFWKNYRLMLYVNKRKVFNGIALVFGRLTVWNIIMGNLCEWWITIELRFSSVNSIFHVCNGCLFTDGIITYYLDLIHIRKWDFWSLMTSADGKGIKVLWVYFLFLIHTKEILWWGDHIRNQYSFIILKMITSGKRKYQIYGHGCSFVVMKESRGCTQIYSFYWWYMVSLNHIQTVSGQRRWSKRYEGDSYYRLQRWSKSVCNIWSPVMVLSLRDLRIKVIWLVCLLLKYIMRRVLRVGVMVETGLILTGIFKPDLTGSDEYLIRFFK